jgi:cell division transport system permease protein
MNERRGPDGGNRRVERGAGGVRFSAPRVPLAAWLGQHGYSLLSSLGRLWQRRGATLLTIAVMALALSLPLLLHLAVRNVERFGGGAQDSRELAVFLGAALDRDAVDAARRAAAAHADVTTVTLRTPDEALEELRRLAGFAEALDLLQSNPLPSVLIVTPRPGLAPDGVHALARALEAIEHVDFVQYDLSWRERLDAAIALARRLALVLGVLLAAGALLVVGNTIRLDVAARADEIAIVQLLGGSDGFVRRPFLYAGLWYGLLAATLALVGVAAVTWALAAPVAELAAGYGSEYRLQGLSAPLAAGTLLAGIVLGWLGAWIVCGRHLARGKPP